MAIQGQAIGKQILEALGMPVERCVSVQIRAAVNEVVTVQAEYHPEGNPKAIQETLQGYLFAEAKHKSDVPVDPHKSIEIGGREVVGWSVEMVNGKPIQVVPVFKPYLAILEEAGPMSLPDRT